MESTFEKFKREWNDSLILGVSPIHIKSLFEKYSETNRNVLEKDVVENVEDMTISFDAFVKTLKHIEKFNNI